MTYSRIKTLLLGSLLTLSAQSSLATIVQIQTDFGDIEVNLFDATTPETVGNFLSYVEDGNYTDTLIHRSIECFITQSGGYYFDEEGNQKSITKKASVTNEPVYSNVRGTIAMAKQGGLPNSATSEWFINLADNSENLDVQNSGFTAFGMVTEAGMAVMDDISELTLLGSVPLVNYTQANYNNSVSLTTANYAYVNAIAVTDTNVSSADTLDPVLNTLINEEPNHSVDTTPCDTQGNSINTSSISNSSGGGNTSFYLLLALVILMFAFTPRKKLIPIRIDVKNRNNASRK